MVLQMPLVMVADLGATLENRLDVIEDAQAHGGGELVEFRVDADALDDVGVDDPEVAQQPHPGRQRVVVGDDGAAFDGVKQLGGMKAQGADVAQLNTDRSL